jgi:cytochrome c-type biogenesis protein
MVPIYLGVLAGAQTSGTADGATRRLRLAGIGFAIGVAGVFVAMGMGVTALTRAMSGVGAWVELVLGTVMLLFGAKMLGWVRLPWFDREARPLLNRVPSAGGFAGGLLFGAGFALGWTPCVGPVLGATLTYAATTTSEPVRTAVMLTSYAMGLATPLVVGAFAASRLLVLASRLRKYSTAIQTVTGALVLAFGAYLALPALQQLSVPSAQTANCGTANACDSGTKKAARVTNHDELPRGPVLVEFVSEHCTVCKKMRPVVSELERNCTDGLIRQVNVDEPAGEKLASHYGISMVPTFVSIDPTGSELERIVGEQTKERLIVALNTVSGKPCSVQN